MYIEIILCFIAIISASESKLQSKNGIVTKAKIQDFPYAVSLLYRGKHGCSGSIIGPKHILTAAHCVETIGTKLYRLTVLSGTSRLSRGGCSHRIKKIKMFPKYHNYTRHNIAVITLRTPMPFDDYQKQIKLSRKSSYAGKEATIVGWGFLSAKNGTPPDFLQKLNSLVKDSSFCKLRTQDITRDKAPVCTVQPDGKGNCYGDGGSGLVVNGEVIGVSSFSQPCDSDYPDTYANVYSFRRFIYEAIYDY